jgi:hypothetical protein
MIIIIGIFCKNNIACKLYSRQLKYFFHGIIVTITTIDTKKHENTKNKIKELIPLQQNFPIIQHLAFNTRHHKIHAFGGDNQKCKFTDNILRLIILNKMQVLGIIMES